MAAGALVAQPKIWRAIPPVYAAHASAYDPDVFPFKAGPLVKAIAKEVKADTELQTAKNLHSRLKGSAAGGLKAVESKKTFGDDRPPRSPEETLIQRCGDCSELAYVVLSAAKELGLEAGTITLDLGNGILHLLPFLKIKGKKYIIDLQTDEFGKGSVDTSSGRVAFTYESLGEPGMPKVLWESTFDQSVGHWHMEWGNYLKSNKDPAKLKQAITAFKKAIELNPLDTHSPAKLDNASVSLVNILMKQADKKISGKTKDWPGAASLFEEAISYAPLTITKEQLASLHQSAGTCSHESGNHAAEAEHYEAAYGLTKNEYYKKLANQARAE